LRNITHRMPETYYSRSVNQSPMVGFSRGDKVTVLLSEVTVPSKQPRTVSDPSLTSINIADWATILDRLFARQGQTGIENELDLTVRDAEGERPDPSESTNNERLVFLARKYAGQASREDNARLEILTQKVRGLMPRVSTSDIDRLSAIADEFADIKKAHQILREKLDLE